MPVTVTFNDNDYERLVQLLQQIGGKDQGLSDYRVNCIANNTVRTIIRAGLVKGN